MNGGWVLEDEVLRKLGAALLALPVLMRIYLPLLAPRGAAGRLVVGGVAGSLIAAVAIAGLPPARSVAVPTADRAQPVAAELLDTVTTGHPLGTPFRFAFDAAMDPASVAAALRIAPDTAVSFSWSADGRTLTIKPVAHWASDTLYAVSVSDAARAVDGAPLARQLRAVILTASAGTAAISATHLSGASARLDTEFRITLDRPAPADAVRVALRIDPQVDGTLAAGSEAGTYVFTPTTPLEPGTRYRVSLDALKDADGVAFAAPPTLVVSTVESPGVVRFRPRNGSADIAQNARLSVRFTDRMDKASTAHVFTVTANGAPVKGTVDWAEQQRVLVFQPAAALPYGAKVVMTVGTGARSRAGVALDAAASGTFTVVPKPKPAPKKAAPRPASRPAPRPAPKPINHSGGGGAVSGTWAAVEAYYLKLMNCTRTGGWVTSGGACSSPGGRSVAPLWQDAGISAKVTRPYAKLLASRGLCDHFVGGTPGDRLSRAGYRSYRWAENLGCRSGNPYSAVLGSHLFFQSEKPYNGGHYRNLMNAAYDRVGIGVWVSGGRVRVAIDFYHP
jgi:uncharacterized protein YkwD